MLTRFEIMDIVNNTHFRDYGFMYGDEGVTVMCRFPNRENDESSASYGSRMKYAQREDTTAYYDDFGPLAFDSFPKPRYDTPIKVMSRYPIGHLKFKNADELHMLLFQLVFNVELHEMMENFYVHGKRILDPHNEGYVVQQQLVGGVEMTLGNTAVLNRGDL